MLIAGRNISSQCDLSGVFSWKWSQEATTISDIMFLFIYLFVQKNFIFIREKSGNKLVPKTKLNCTPFRYK